MKVKAILFLVLFILTSTLMAQDSGDKNPSAKLFYAAVDSLAELKQPNRARTELLVKLQEAERLEDVNLTLIGVRYYQKLLADLETEERAALFFSLFQKVDQYSEPTQSLVRLELIQGLTHEFYTWFRRDYLEIYDTIDLSSSYVRSQFVAEQIELLEHNIEALQAYKFQPFSSTLVLQEKQEKLYRNLGDFVAYQLLQLYESSLLTAEGDKKHASLGQEEWYSTPDQFTQLKFKEDNLTVAMLRLFQKIEKNNLDYANFLSIATYHRIKFLEGQFSNESMVLSAHESQFNYFYSSSARSKFLFSIAENKYRKGLQYHHQKKPEVENLIKSAHTALENELKTYPDSDFSIEFSALLKMIENKSVEISVPKMSASNAKIPFLIKYRNHDNYVLRVYRVTDANPIGKKALRQLALDKELELVQTHNLALEHKGLFQKRSMELLLDEVTEQGRYFIVGSTEAKSLEAAATDNQAWNNLKLTHTNFVVSDILVESKVENNLSTIVVTDFHAGTPVKGADVSLFYYDRRLGKEKFLLKKGKTNKEGVYCYPIKTVNNQAVYYLVTYKGSALSSSEYFQKLGTAKNQHSVKLLTDRSIYRPGQTVYFKGIAYEGKANEYHVLTNKKVRLKLRDANYQVVYEKEFKTNEFGSFDGSYTLPMGGLLGHYGLQAEVDNVTSLRSSSQQSFKVEEYKRPTYEVVLNQPEKEAKLNAVVQLSGNALAYAGYPIANAKVEVQVYRNWTRFWRSYFPFGGSGDLLKTETIESDENGDFSIEFFAETDPNAQPFSYYYYEVKAKVTDVSGETHEAQIHLTLNELGLALELDVPEKIFAHDKGTFTPKVVNLAGKVQDLTPNQVKVEIYSKKEAPRFLDRIWENAEYSWNKEEEKEFSKLYPNRVLNAYHSPKNELIKTAYLELGKTVAWQDFIQKELGGKQGEYGLKFTYITEENQELTFERYIVLIDVAAKNLPKQQALWTFVSSNEAEVGEAVDFQVGSSFANAQALVSFYRGKELVSEEWVQLKNRKSICYTIEEKDRGVLSYQVLLIQNGEVYTAQQLIHVPFSNKELDIVTETFRDKLEPGQQERWTFKINDYREHFPKTELAATMYDASLDYFTNHAWYLKPYSSSAAYLAWRNHWGQRLNTARIGGVNSWEISNLSNSILSRYNWSTERFKIYFGYYYIDGIAVRGARSAALEEVEVTAYKAPLVQKDGAAQGETVTREDIAMLPVRTEGEEYDEVEDEAIQAAFNPRENFDETAFFYPTIYANSQDEYVLDFTLPESLTKWKLLMLGHTKELEIGLLQKEIEAKKELMITPNAPRFVREGDRFDFSAKVVNLTDEAQEVTVNLVLENPISLAAIHAIQGEAKQKLTVPANGTVEVSWEIEVPEEEVLQYTVTAENAHFSDGERSVLPVLSSRILVTETTAELMKGKGEKTVDFNAFKTNNSTSLSSKTYTVEYIDNLAWQAVLALPSLSTGNDKSATSLINAYYGNAVANYILDKTPKIQQIFKQWKNQSPDLFLSELEKNQDLKNMVLSETPWVAAAKDEAEQRRRIAQLFELNQVQINQAAIIRSLKKLQNADGGFSWFEGGKSSPYITQSVLNRLGHLSRLGISIKDFDWMLSSAERYVANEQIKYYDKYIDKMDKRDYLVSINQVNWLYSRTFFQQEKSDKLMEVEHYYQERLKKEWTRFNPYMQALIGIYFNKVGITKERDLIYTSLLDRAKKNTPIGMYWVENSGWYWHDNKISTQAMIISFFQDMKTAEDVMDDARLWLILNKEANAWETGVETADAVYAVLLTGKDYLQTSERPQIVVGNRELVYEVTENPQAIQVDYVEGLGQVKQQWMGEEINKDLGTVTVKKKSDAPAVLNLYWQYMEDISKVEASTNASMKVQKKYYRLVPGAKTEEGLEGTQFTVGDKVEVEIIVTVDRDLEFVHLKDLRPAGFEPRDVNSGYRWNGGAAYYQSPKDASMEFFIEHLAKGTYKFTYTVYATHSGTFNAGMATLQSYYAPKFSGHSRSEKVVIDRK